MRPNTRASGICSTNRNSPVSTSTFTRMLVPKPNNAFQSPGTQNFGRLRLHISRSFCCSLHRCVIARERLR